MQFLRIFSTDNYKGTRDYLKTQKKYEILRTLLYFAISLSIFIGGWATTKTRLNLLTVVAVVGCLPACKSLVGMIMFLRFQGCAPENARIIEAHTEGLTGLFDMVFTSYEKNYNVAHITVKGNTLCGFTQDAAFDEQAFYKHLDGILKLEHYKDVSVKIFKDIHKYADRLEQLKSLNAEEENTAGIVETLKSVAL
ncbi:MAG: hypothetical protein NC251_06535 [Lachnoclostridium sp.]|nr:hypothetical protein [Lachnospira sp.]MCM1248072.1 hypothetical protein [Lachnoclostridium sp.]